MSPLGILAVLADQRSSLTFSQVRWGYPCGCFTVLVSLFLSLRPQLGLNEARQDRADEIADDRASSRTGIEPTRSGFPSRRAEAPPLTSGRSLCVRCHQPGIFEQATDGRLTTPGQIAWPSSMRGNGHPQRHGPGLDAEAAVRDIDSPCVHGTLSTAGTGSASDGAGWEVFCAEDFACIDDVDGEVCQTA